MYLSALVASPLKLWAVTAPAAIPKFKDMSRDLRYAPLTQFYIAYFLHLTVYVLAKFEAHSFSRLRVIYSDTQPRDPVSVPCDLVLRL